MAIEFERLTGFFDGDVSSFKRAAGEALSLADQVEARFQKLNETLKVGAGGSLSKELADSLRLQNALNNAARVEERTKAASISTQIKSVQLERERLRLIDQQARNSKKSDNTNAGLQRANADIARYQAQQRRAEEQLTTVIQREANKQERARISGQQRATSEVLSGLKKIEAEELRTSAAAKKQNSGSGLRNSAVGSFVGNLASNAVTKITGDLVAGGAAVLDYSAKLEQARIGFTSLTGSVAAANKHLEDLQNFAKTTPFDLDGLARGSQLLQGVGIKTEKVIPILSDFGNALAAAGKGNEEINRTVLALSQIAAKGKLAGQEINQLAENGIPAVSILSQALGKPKAEIIALSEQGKISFDLLIEAMHRVVEQNGIGDAMVRQSHTFNGATENIKDSLLQLADKAFKPLFDKASHIADDLASVVSRQDADFGDIGKAIGKAITEGMGAAIAAGAGGIKAELAREFSKILQGDFSEISTPGGFGSSLAEESLKSAGKVSVTERINQYTARLGGYDSSVAEKDARRISPQAASDFFGSLKKGNLIDSITGNSTTKIGAISREISKVAAEVKKVPSLDSMLLPGKEAKAKKAKIEKEFQIGSLSKLVSSSGKPDFDFLYNKYGKQFGVDPNILLAQGRQENGFKMKGVSSAGAAGPAQFIPATAKRFNVDVNNLESSIRGQAQYMSQLLSMFGGRNDLALAGYNWGEGSRKKGNRKSLYNALDSGQPVTNFKIPAETRNYVKSILGNYQKSTGGGKSKLEFGTFDQEGFNKELSDTQTKNQRDKITRTLIDLYTKQGLIPSPDLLRDFTDLAKEEAQKTGAAQPSAASIAQNFKLNAFGSRGEVSVNGAPLATAPIEQRTTSDDEYLSQMKDRLGITEKIDEIIHRTTNYEQTVSLGVQAQMSEQYLALLDAQTQFDGRQKQNADATFVQQRRDLENLRETNDIYASIDDLKDKIASAGINDNLIIEEAHLRNLVDLRQAELQKIIEGNRTIGERLRLFAAQTPGYKTIGKDFLGDLPNQVGNTLGNIAQQWDGTWSGMFKSAKQGFGQMLLDLAQQYLKSAVASLIGKLVGVALSAFAGGAKIGSDTSSITGLGTTMGHGLGSITPRAAGGPVTGGATHLVGELGPEIFVPKTSGTILTNDVTKDILGGGRGQSNTNNYTINQTIHAPRGTVPAKSARQAAEGALDGAGRATKGYR